jgi:TP901 family phage tail tape measure protein
MNGTSTLGIGLTMFLRDQFSGPAGRIRNSNRALQEDLRKAQEEQLRYQRNLNAGVALMGGAALRGLSRLVTKASEFGYEMEFVKSITSATIQEGRALGKLSMDLGQATMFTGQQVAEGMRFMAMAGMDSKQVSENIKAAVSLAGSTKSLLEGKGGSADIMTNVMKQFQISFKYTQDVADLLTYGTTRANTNLFDLGEAIKYAGSTSMDLNVSLPETIAMVMALGNAGLQGSMAGVAMENSMRYMSRAFSDFGSGPSRKALELLGLTVQDVTDNKGNLISMTEVMKKMGKAIDSTYGSGMNIAKQNILQNIFGVRGKRAASLFLRNLQEFDKFTNELSTKSAGHSDRIMSDMMNTLRGQMYQTSSAWQNMWVSFTEGIAPVLIPLLGIFRDMFITIQKLFQIKYLGPALATGIGSFLLLQTAAAGYRAISAGIRLVHMGMTSSFASTAATTVSGYSAMTIAARAYNAQLSKGQIGSIVGNLSRTQGGVLSMAASGAFYRNRPGRGGNAGFVSTAVASRYARMYGIERSAVSVAGGAVTKGVLGRVLGFLGGPVGLALSFVLPAAIGALASAIKSNKESTDKNTNALDKNKSSEGSMLYSSDYVPMQLGPRILALQGMGNQYITQAMVGSGFEGAVERAFSKLVSSGGTGDIIINLDGDTIFRAPMDKIKKDFKSIGIY